MRVRPLEPRDRNDWLAMRGRLWPDDGAEHAACIDAFLAGGDDLAAVLIAEAPDGAPAGFVEISIRSHVDACGPGPTPFVEGWWVEPAMRGRGLGGALMRAAWAWAKALGHDEIGSDALVDNHASHAAHRALGFVETGRVVLFRKNLT